MRHVVLGWYQASYSQMTCKSFSCFNTLESKPKRHTPKIAGIGQRGTPSHTRTDLTMPFETVRPTVHGERLLFAAERRANGGFRLVEKRNRQPPRHKTMSTTLFATASAIPSIYHLRSRKRRSHPTPCNIHLMNCD